MDFLHSAIELAALVISVAGIIIVLWGTVEAVYRFLTLKLPFGRDKTLCRETSLRQDLGAHLLLGLEIFIAADVINSVANPSWQKVGLLGAIVGIRTVLSFFLYMEMKGEVSLEGGMVQGSPSSCADRDGGDLV